LEIGDFRNNFRRSVCCLQSTAEEGYAEYIWKAIDEKLDQENGKWVLAGEGREDILSILDVDDSLRCVATSRADGFASKGSDPSL
jgi:hypothetical protein